MNERRRQLMLGMLLGGAGLLWRTETAYSKSSKQRSIPSSQPLKLSAEALSIFDKLMNPFIEAANARRDSLLNNPKDPRFDPEYGSRVDWELNKNRINFLIFADGVTNEPKDKGDTDNIGLIGTHQVFSYDIERRVIDIVAPTHDVRAPEIERFRKDFLKEKSPPTKIFNAYSVGESYKAGYGFRLQKQILERMTGLSVDFQFCLSDETLAYGIDKCFGKIPVNIPKTFETHAAFFRRSGDKVENLIKIPKKVHEAGVWELDGKEAMALIKTVPANEVDQRRPDPELEHNARKKWVADAVMKALRANVFNPLMWGNMAAFSSEGRIKTDFETTDLLLGNIGSVASSLGLSLFDGTRMSFMPTVDKNIYLVDIKHGAGGFRWISEVERLTGEYVDPNMEIPIDGDPDAEDLLRYYWDTLRGPRSVVKTLLAA